jgi:tetratricopeptide (TPR) repeat protein
MILAASCLIPSSLLRAGLSASETVVVVNGESLNSRTLANHYVRLRQIPAINVIVLTGVPDSEQITVDQFRHLILTPVFQEIETRKLAGHIQCIAYSADFPTAIDISKDLSSIKDLHKVFSKKVGSINSLTYLYQLVLKADATYITPEVNFYARRPMGAYFTNPGGSETEKAWADINLLQEEQKFAQASEQLDQLIEKIPYQFPLKYLSAAHAAQANQADKALSQLEEAINAGWNSRGYLEADKRFDSLRERPAFKNLVELLEPDSGKWQPTVPFNSRSAWAANGVEFTPNPQASNLGLRYMLSTVLGVTRGVGNSLEQAIAALNRAAQADFTHPSGAFYFCHNQDVRAKTRQPGFELAIAELKQLGFDAEVIPDVLPKKRPRVLGAQLGTSHFDWTTSASEIVPGAIVENLTSLGGVMTKNNNQTPLTDLIAAGAAGSSGTVTEPYAVQFKFPTPHLYVHYAQGLTLAEAFYQSVTGPYQLLIVGDPLCQPFSIAPCAPLDSTLREIQANGTVEFQLELSGPNFDKWSKIEEHPARRQVQLRPQRIAVQIDGGSLQAGLAQPSVSVKLDNSSAGYHEIQVVQVADDPLRQRHAQMIPVWVGRPDWLNYSVTTSNGDPISMTSVPAPVSAAAGPLSFSLVAPKGCSELAVYHNYEMLDSTKVSEPEVKLSVDTSKLGNGPVRLQLKAKQEDGSRIASKPLWIELTP